MYKVKEIFYKYEDEIARHQYKKCNHISTLDLNAENKKTKFQLDLENNFFSKNIKYYIAGELTPADATKSYNNESNIKMVDNFVAHLFSHIEVKKHDTLIDEIDYPGIASTLSPYSSTVVATYEVHFPSLALQSPLLASCRIQLVHLPHQLLLQVCLPTHSPLSRVSFFPAEMHSPL